jgi:hypothetical protein
MLCDSVDGDALDIIVLSSPDSVRLYSKFGFKAVAAMETKEGSLTSMLFGLTCLVKTRQ